MTSRFFAAVLATAFFACNNPATEPAGTGTRKKKTREDTLYQQALDIHNEIMPKVGKLMSYQQLAQRQMDSIKAIISTSALPTEMTRRIAGDVSKLDVLNDSLKAAEQAMNDWMDGFDPDIQLPTTEERAAYFADQKQKAEVMKVRFMQALASADSFFMKR